MQQKSETFTSTSYFFGEKPVEAFDALTKKSSASLDGLASVFGKRLDVEAWLPLLGASYNISSDIRDYVLVPCPVVLSDVPNTNGDFISKDELLRWLPDDGMPAYMTLRGKPTFVEHRNTDHTKASGVIFDAYLAPVQGYRGNRAKLMALLGFDRQVDPTSTSLILSGESNTYSMGCRYSAYRCSKSRRICNPGESPSSYTKPGQALYQNAQKELIYRELLNIRFFETSRVGNPAFAVCVGDHVLTHTS